MHSSLHDYNTDIVTPNDNEGVHLHGCPSHGVVVQ